MWKGPDVLLPGVPDEAPRIVGVASPLPLLPPAWPWPCTPKNGGKRGHRQVW
jgi:hypothetical protein